jgi:hypothetical protein
MAGFHVEEFDGENVSGALELFAGEDKRGLVAFFGPPLGNAVEGFEFGRTGALYQAKDVDVGMTFMEFAGGRGAVEGDGLEILFCRGLQAID